MLTGVRLMVKTPTCGMAKIAGVKAGLGSNKSSPTLLYKRRGLTKETLKESHDAAFLLR
jgi:hypothetical protein